MRVLRWKSGVGDRRCGAAGFVALALLASLSPARAQDISPELLTTRWTAHWIRPAVAPPKAFGVYHLHAGDPAQPAQPLA